jgi:hypothetical protein
MLHYDGKACLGQALQLIGAHTEVIKSEGLWVRLLKYRQNAHHLLMLSGLPLHHRYRLKS